MTPFRSVLWWGTLIIVSLLLSFSFMYFSPREHGPWI